MLRIALPFTQYRYLFYQLVQRETKARYKQSLIGYAWVIFNPLAQLLVYSFVFSVIFSFPKSDVPYALFLYTGLLPWTFLQTSLTTATMSLVENAPLLRKINFPREVIPYSFVLSKLVDLLFSSLVLFLFFLAYGQPFRLSMLGVIPLLAVQVLFTSGLALILSAANLFYRDIQYLTNLVLMLWMYMTPVVYPLSLVPPALQSLYLLNPMVGIIESYRALMFGQPVSWNALGVSVVMSLLTFIVGYIFFKKSERVFADIV